MTSKTISDIEEYIRVKMVLIYFFADRFEGIIDNDVKYNKDILCNVKSKYEEVKDIEFSNMTFRRVAELKLENSELYEKIIVNFNSSLQKSIIEANISIAENNFKELGLNATFLISYSLFEEAISRICDVTCKMKKLQISWKDLRGSTLEAFKTYFMKVINIDFNFSENKNWDLIKKYQRIRNYITHNGSLSNDSDDFSKISKDIFRLKNIKLDDGVIIIGKDFILDSLLVYEDFFKSLIESIKKINVIGED